VSPAGGSAAPPIALQRGILLTAVAVTAVASWTYVVGSAHHMMGGHPHELLAALPVWAAMMTGMMLPGAAPMFAAYAGVNRRNGGRWAPLAAFVAAYLSLWIAVSVAGAVLQQWLTAAGLSSPMGTGTRPLLAAAVLLVAGMYQFSPLKQACLRRCRTPLGFLLTEWRPGTLGALRMGGLHGVECLLCCWALMALMFVLGAMHLLWMAVLTVVMLVEKAAPAGPTIGRWCGALLIGSGLAVAFVR
jgi:predicted metal-binding membrane protein